MLSQEALSGLGMGAAKRGASGHGVSGADASTVPGGHIELPPIRITDRQSIAASQEAFPGRIDQTPIEGNCRILALLSFGRSGGRQKRRCSTV